VNNIIGTKPMGRFLFLAMVLAVGISHKKRIYRGIITIMAKGKVKRDSTNPEASSRRARPLKMKKVSRQIYNTAIATDSVLFFVSKPISL